ncbi:MAG: hypothetical protein ACTSRI_15295 [Promethearchaeota archaeon]
MSQKAQKRKPKTRKVDFRSKSWYSITAPKSFDYKKIGEIYGVDNNVKGRTIEALLYDFTNNYRDISLKLKFKIVDVNSESKKCNSIFLGHEFTNDFVRSLIGRGSTKIVLILNLTTKDKYVFRLTMICTTIKRARSSQQAIIRKIMLEILKEFANSLNHEKFITGMIYGEFQNQIQRIAKTIYPLSNANIIKSKLISIPEGGGDKEFVPKNEEFEIIEVDVKRSRKSDIKRTERINVKKFTQNKNRAERKNQNISQKEESTKPEKTDDSQVKKEESTKPEKTDDSQVKKEESTKPEKTDDSQVKKED